MAFDRIPELPPFFRSYIDAELIFPGAVTIQFGVSEQLPFRPTDEITGAQM
jgi:hypothetical protein